MRLVNPGFCLWFSGSYSVFFFPLLMNFEFRVINIGAVETKQGNNCFLLFDLSFLWGHKIWGTPECKGSTFTLDPDVEHVM